MHILASSTSITSTYTVTTHLVNILHLHKYFKCTVESEAISGDYIWNQLLYTKLRSAHEILIITYYINNIQIIGHFRIYCKSLNRSPQLLLVQLGQTPASIWPQYSKLVAKCNHVFANHSVYKHFDIRLISPQIMSDINNVQFPVFLWGLSQAWRGASKVSWRISRVWLEDPACIWLMASVLVFKARLLFKDLWYTADKLESD